MIWFVPTWSGDLRLEPSEKKPDRETILTIVSPTEAEKKILDLIQTEAVKQGWIYPSVRAERSGFLWRKKRVTLSAAMSVVGPIVARKFMRPGPAVLTALLFRGGQIIATEAGPAELQEALAGTAPALDEVAAKRDEKEKEKAKPEEKKPEEPKAAATVKRPTPSCPQCIPGAIEPASEVLLTFLNEEEHESWAKSRSIVVEGGLSGHRYLLSHRHSETAQKVGRICYDLDAERVVHFHDWTVPPEEEILAAKLILEHREPWLRNEATMFGYFGRDTIRFKNPFGNGSDGVQDAMFAENFGLALAETMKQRKEQT